MDDQKTCITCEGPIEGMKCEACEEEVTAKALDNEEHLCEDGQACKPMCAGCRETEDKCTCA